MVPKIEVVATRMNYLITLLAINSIDKKRDVCYNEDSCIKKLYTKIKNINRRK